MADFQVSYLPLALADLEEIFQYIVHQLKAPKAAQKLLEKINAAVDQLVESPYSHPVFQSSRALKKEYRKVTVKNFYVFYVVEKNIVEIHRVIYSKRDLGTLLGT